MSILNVEHLTHGFGDRAIFDDVSFRLLKGEHIGLVGANGEGKSTFMSIVTGKLTPDEGKVEWAKNVRAGYLDQHAVLQSGMTIQDVLKSAFDPLLQKEQRMNLISSKEGLWSCQSSVASPMASCSLRMQKIHLQVQRLVMLKYALFLKV